MLGAAAVETLDLGFSFLFIPRIAVVPVDPGSVSQTLGGAAVAETS